MRGIRRLPGVSPTKGAYADFFTFHLWSAWTNCQQPVGLLLIWDALKFICHNFNRQTYRIQVPMSSEFVISHINIRRRSTDYKEPVRLFYRSYWIYTPPTCAMGYRYSPLRFQSNENVSYTVYPKKYAHGFVVLCFVVVMQSFIMNSHEVFIHIHQGCLLALGQSLDCHSASEVSLMDMGKSVNV